MGITASLATRVRVTHDPVSPATRDGTRPARVPVSARISVS